MLGGFHFKRNLGSQRTEIVIDTYTDGKINGLLIIGDKWQPITALETTQF